jgi:hypothetical protein
MTAVILQFSPRSTNFPAHEGDAAARTTARDVAGCAGAATGVAKAGALRTLALTPCRNDAEFIEKLRLLLEIERELWRMNPGDVDAFGATLLAADLHLNPTGDL